MRGGAYPYHMGITKTIMKRKYKGGVGGPYRLHGVAGHPGEVYSKSLHGPVGYGKVHYTSREHIVPSDRQQAYRQHVKAFMRQNPLPSRATREQAQQRMAAAAAAWRAGPGRTEEWPDGITDNTVHHKALKMAERARLLREGYPPYPPSQFVAFA